MKIFLSRTDGIGDVILALPVAKVVKDTFKNSEVSFLVSSYVSPILENYPYIDRVITFSGYENILDLISMFKKEKPDIVIFIFPVFKLALAAFIARVPLRIGTAFRTYSFAFNERVWENRRPSIKHESEYNVSMLRALGIKVPNIIPPQLFLTEKERNVGEAFLSQLPRPRIIIHPGAVTNNKRNWPIDKYGMLAEELKRVGCSVIFTGNESDRENFEKHIKGKYLNLMEKLSLRQLLGVIAASDLLISGATGAMHMAAAQGIPTLSFFVTLKRHHPRRWHPLGNRHIILLPDEEFCRKNCNKRNHHTCLNSISVDEAKEKSLHLLKD